MVNCGLISPKVSNNSFTGDISNLVRNMEGVIYSKGNFEHKHAPSTSSWLEHKQCFEWIWIGNIPKE